MKSKLFLLSVLAFATAILLAFTIKNQGSTTLAKSSIKKTVIRCGPDWEALEQFLEETDIPPMPGSGSHHWAISTRNDSAQFYFDQGMNMYYSFHIIESMASFKKSSSI